SVERATRFCFAGALGVAQSNCQNRQAFGFGSPSTVASFQADPPSVLTSTRTISLPAAQAAPRMRTLEFAATVSPRAGLAISAFTCSSATGLSSAISPRLFQYA